MKLKKYLPPLVMWLVFKAIAVTLWLTLDNLFFLFNFSYIGTAVGLGLVLYGKRKSYARHVVQLAVGLYMLLYLGVLCRENMQIEGFWYYLFLGVFEAATIHYVVAKIFGPLLFGRGWCGYACWTAMVLDLLPFKTPAAPRRRWGRSGILCSGPRFFLPACFSFFRSPIKRRLCGAASLWATSSTMWLELPWPICARTTEHFVNTFVPSPFF